MDSFPNSKSITFTATSVGAYSHILYFKNEEWRILKNNNLFPDDKNNTKNNGEEFNLEINSITLVRTPILNLINKNSWEL